jgi:hypothetical protein
MPTSPNQPPEYHEYYIQLSLKYAPEYHMLQTLNPWQAHTKGTKHMTEHLQHVRLLVPPRRMKQSEEAAAVLDEPLAVPPEQALVGIAELLHGHVALACSAHPCYSTPPQRRQSAPMLLLNSTLHPEP